jgi:hypothetical protein
MSMTIRTYSELRTFDSFKERYNYLKLHGHVGRSTFGFDRYLNQQFYTSRDWRQLRYEIIVRDNGCDLGIDGYEIHHGLYVHHMNPLNVDHISSRIPDILDPEFLITVRHQTHNAIHYGNEDFLTRKSLERRPGDTRLW